MPENNKKVVVIGAGVAGLSAGVYDLKLGYRVELFEKNAVPGVSLYDLYRETRLIDDSIDVLRNDVMYTSWLNGQKLSLLDTWTPCTYKRYCNAHNGYNQACILPKEANMRTAYPSPFVKGLKNVVLAGQWISPQEAFSAPA